MTREALLALAERLEDAADDVRGDFSGTSLYQREYDVMMEAVTALRALATPPAGEDSAGLRHDRIPGTDGKLLKATPVKPAGETPQGETRKVGCEGTDGLLRVHPESETCDVCATPDRSEG